MPFWQEQVTSAAAYLLRQCGPLRFPVDLTRLATQQGITRIHFRPLPCDGAIAVAVEGFAVHVESAKEQLVPVSALNSAALSPRQRFTLAHEICHTFFYDGSRKPRKPQPATTLLESLCNFGAERLLLPDYLLEREIGAGRRFDSIEMAVDIAAAAQVSVEVLLQRLDALEGLKETDYALLALRRQNDGSVVTTGVCLNGVFATLPSPVLYAAPPSWVTRIAAGLNPTNGAVRRRGHREGWEFITRCVPSGQSMDKLFVESKFDMASR